MAYEDTAFGGIADYFNLGDTLTGLFGGALETGTALLPYYAGEGILDYLKQARETVPGAIEGIETGAMGELDFTPYTVTTGLGSTAISPEGVISTTLTPEQQAVQQSLLSQAQTLAGTAGPTAGELYEQIQATRAPETERQRLALENRLAAQGRLGTQTAMYGGTPEALAMEKAIAEQQSRDILGAQTTAGALEAQRLANVGGLLTQAYAPEQQMLSALYGAAPLSSLGESQARSRSQLLRDLGITELETEQSLLGNIAGFEADRIRALGQALSGLFAQPKQTISLESFLTGGSK
jgi:hypothetical protein